MQLFNGGGRKKEITGLIYKGATPLWPPRSEVRAKKIPGVITYVYFLYFLFLLVATWIAVGQFENIHVL